MFKANSARWYTNFETRSLYIRYTSSAIRSDSSNKPNYVQISGFDEFAICIRPSSYVNHLFLPEKISKKKDLSSATWQTVSPSWSSIIFRFSSAVTLPNSDQRAHSGSLTRLQLAFEPLFTKFTLHSPHSKRPVILCKIRWNKATS